MAPIGFTETPLMNQLSALRDIPQERRSRLQRGGSLKSSTIAVCLENYTNHINTLCVLVCGCVEKVELLNVNDLW
jgi:hypothetical protein